MSSDLWANPSKCEFCYAFFVDPSKEAEHNRKCEFRLSRTFVACDGKVKLACTVCRDTFATESELKSHENLHKHPGGYVCSMCDGKFRNDAACIRHQTTIHQLFRCLLCEDDDKISTKSGFEAHLEAEHNGKGRYAVCKLCDAHFEQKSYLRLHTETNCGRWGTWNCSECGMEFVSENALSEHTRTNHIIIPIEDDCIKVEENPLVLPKIEVSTIDYLISETDGNFGIDGESSEFLAMEVEAIANDVGVDNEDAQMGWKQDRPSGVKPEFDSFDDNHGSDNEDDGDEDEDEDGELEDMDCLNLVEHWKHTTDNTFECNTCELKFDTLDEVEEHVIVHDPTEDRDSNASDSGSDDCDSSSSDWRATTVTNNKSGRNKHKCPYCDWTYFTVKRRDQHIKLHGPGGKLVHKCSCCRFFFETREEMLKHRFKTHKETVCNICRPRLTFKNSSELAAHRKVRHRKKGSMYKCRICLSEFRLSKELAKHGWEEHTSTTCPDCGKIFAKAADYRRHTSKRVCQNFGVNAVIGDDIEGIDSGSSMGSETQEDYEEDSDSNSTKERNVGNADLNDSTNAASNAADNEQKMKIMKKQLSDWKRLGVRTANAVCTICHIKYGYVWHFEKHIKVHGPKGQLTIKCKHCPKLLGTDADVKKHIAVVHNHACHLCERAYLGKTALRIHLESAHERYKCDKCGSTFNRKVGLDKHIRTDCGTIAQHKCAFCGDSFHTAGELKEHEIQHANDSNHMCSTCGKQFEKLYSLKLHVAQAHRRSFECRYCGSLFKSRYHLLKHLSEHMGILPFRCLSCNEQYSSKPKLDMHLRENPKTCNRIPFTDECIINIDADDAETQFNLSIKPNEFPCKYCGAIFVSISNRRVHLANCAANKNLVVRHRCVKCNLTFPRRKERSEHMEKVHKELKCKYCDKRFKMETSLMKHISLHGPDGAALLKCSCCLQHFATDEERTRHEFDEHIEKLKCHICNKVFRDPRSLRSHVEHTHEKKYSQMCTKCGKVFPTVPMLKSHENSDCGKTLIFKCEHCGKCLSNTYTLRSHIEIMHGNAKKRFVCSFCGKAWYSKAGLQSHLRNHTGEKPYNCDYCERAFASRVSKMTHETTHTGIKPYMCQCGDRFSCISNLQSHRKARKTTCGLLPLNSKRFPDKIKSMNVDPV